MILKQSLSRWNVLVGGLMLLVAGLTVRYSFGEPTEKSNSNAAENLRETFAQYKTWKPTTPKPVFIASIAKPLFNLRGSACGPSIPKRPKPGPHGDHYIHVFVSPNARNLFFENNLQQPSFPEGTVIVKEKLQKISDAKPSELGVMVKRQKGYSADTGDWQYLFVDQDGQLIASQQLKNCATCHARAPHDSVFGHRQAK